MNNTRNLQATLLDLIGESIGLPETGLMRIAVSASAFDMTFYAIRYIAT